jgi:hypothetical protein
MSGRSFLTSLIVDDAEYEVDGWLQVEACVHHDRG